MSQKRRVTLYRGGNKANDDRETGTASFQASDELMAREAMGDPRTGNALRYRKGRLKGQKKFKQSSQSRLRSTKAKNVAWVTKHKGKRVRLYATFRMTLKDGSVVIRKKQRTFSIRQYRDVAGANNDMARQLIAAISEEQGDSDFSIETLGIDGIAITRKKKKRSDTTTNTRKAKNDVKKSGKSKGKAKKSGGKKGRKAATKANRAPKR